VNSEELELSLRTEFESYLKNILAEMKQEVTEFQSKVETEFENHKKQFNDAFEAYAARFDSTPQFDEAFTGSVMEHIRLARDEGAKITANAMAEAEKLEPVAAPVEVKYDAIRDAVNDISTKNSQATILKSLVKHAAEFAPRGAFFIVKNEQFAGWKVFGNAGDMAENAIRDVLFQTADDSIIGSAIRSVSTVEEAAGAFADDSKFLDPLHFGHPDRMFAIPLVARGRGVAVLYADYGNDGVNVNREALETIVRVAGLTVELLASSQVARADSEKMAAADFEDASHDTVEDHAPAAEERFEESHGSMSEMPAETSEYRSGMPAGVGFANDIADQADISHEHSFTESTMVEPSTEVAFDSHEAVDQEQQFEYTRVDDSASSADEFDAEEDNVEAPVSEFEAPVEEETVSAVEPVSYEETIDEEPAREYEAPIEDETASSVDAVSYEETIEEMPAREFEASVEEETVSTVDAVSYEETIEETSPATAETFVEDDHAFETIEAEVQPEPEPESVEESVTFDAPDSIESPAFAGTGFDSKMAEEYEPAGAISSGGYNQVVEPVAEVAAIPVTHTRLRDRPVDLPIEVPDDERRIHNDARRFARLLVSEIKLYNEKKVTEGREASDLYERLREAIDRSREMYDKRVQPPVAAKFDYFHYELVNALAEGDAVRLGSSYPGSAV